jgi:periplasmic protein TonB
MARGCAGKPRPETGATIYRILAHATLWYSCVRLSHRRLPPEFGFPFIEEPRDPMIRSHTTDSIPDRQWPSPLCLAVAVHLLVFLAGMYGLRPGQPPAAEQEIYPVTLLSLADFGRAQPEPGEKAIKPAIPGQRLPPVPLSSPPPLATLTAPQFSEARIEPAAVRVMTDEARPEPEPDAVAPAQRLPPVTTADEDDAREHPAIRHNGTPADLENPAAAGESAMPASAPPAVAGTAGPAAEQLRRQYLARLAAHIEAHKFYPPAARRRQMTGEVQVRFVLTADGGISDLRANGANPVLEQAAIAAVEQSQPLPPPGAWLQIPLAVSYRMEFRLR